MLEPAALILTALGIDALIGDPHRVYRRVPHPVALLGSLISAGERAWNRPRAKPIAAIAAGAALVVVVVAIAVLIAHAAHLLLAKVPLGAWLEAVIASSLIAFRGLYSHVRDVANALARGLDEARDAVAHIVGRDPQSLDEAGVARAAIESAAENFSDGVVAPVFWGVLFGLPGIAAYKAINTLDSMIGHRSSRYLLFGRIAARLDDIVNWLPARLAGALFCIAALALPGADARNGLRRMLADAPRHRSPNAGWQEAAVAGALNIALAGPRRYGEEIVDDAWMGNGRRDVTAEDVHRALALYLIAGLVLAAVLLLAVLA